MSSTSDVATAAAKIAPAVPAPVAVIFGLNLSEWAAVASIAYVVLQTAFLLWPKLKPYLVKET